MGMCTTSAECNTVMTVMLMVMSIMDPHMIRVTWVGMVGKLGVGQSCHLGRAAVVDSVVCSVQCRISRRTFGFSLSSLA
jgi:hypothetical protein